MATRSLAGSPCPLGWIAPAILPSRWPRRPRPRHGCGGFGRSPDARVTDILPVWRHPFFSDLMGNLDWPGLLSDPEGMMADVREDGVL